MAHEVVRRLAICDTNTKQQDLNNTLENFIVKLTNSGYRRNQIEEIITCGIKGYIRKMDQNREKGIPRHRFAKESFQDREKKNLTIKNTWYKPKKSTTSA